MIKEYQFERIDEDIYIKSVDSNKKELITDKEVPISLYNGFDEQNNLLCRVKNIICEELDKMAQLKKEPSIKMAMRFKENNTNPELISDYKPLVPEQVVLDNLLFISNLGSLKYIDLSNIKLPNIENLDLSYSNIKINLKDYKSIRNTNLTNIPLLFQSLDGIDTTGANLKGTHVLVDVNKTLTDGTIFDDTCIFWQNKRELSKEEAKLLGLIVQERDYKQIKLTLPHY